jgi:hypothetical protein
MSYAITLWCGCRVYVSCDPRTRIAHHRIIERRGDRCSERRHAVGLRLRLWELLPDSRRHEAHLKYEQYDVNG